jgi:HEAT repeat protein
VPYLAPLLKDPDVDVRVSAAWALGQIESAEAIPALEAAEADESAAVRRAVRWALGQIDDDRSVRVRPRIRIRN